MLVEKEIIGPATHWYRDEATGLPRKLVVTPELTRYWHEQGNKMLGMGLTVPVPCEHDFDSHPMTPADKLKNNAGWVKEYRLKDEGGRKDVLFGIVDVQDDELAKKLPRTIRWTSPWISSFTDGDGHHWNNVISHLALTTRPRIIKQAPFGSIAAALSLATETRVDDYTHFDVGGAEANKGFCISKAGKLVERKKDSKLRPQYPLAFSMYSGGIKLADDEDMMPLKDDGDEDMGGEEEGEDADDEMGGLMNPLQDSGGDVQMEELLCDLLNALGVQMPDNVGESEFKRALYEATMSKIKELSAKGQASGDANAQAGAANTTSPAGGQQQNPLIQQEQQPMYMSLEEINKLPAPMKGVALAMYNENVKLRGELDANTKVTASLRDAKIKEAAVQRNGRVALLGKLSPRVKMDLDAMLALPSMALSMGDGGVVIDPLAQTLAVLEKGLADMPRLLTVEQSALSVQSQPTDADALTDEATNELADSMARMMGCPPERKAS